MNHIKLLPIFLFPLFVIQGCSDGASAEYDSEENRLEKTQSSEESTEVSEEKIKELELLESTNDSLRQIDQELDQFIESLNE